MAEARYRGVPHRRLVTMIGVLLLLVTGTTYLLFDIWAAASLKPGVVLLACAASLPGSLLLVYGRTYRMRLAVPIVVILCFFAVTLINWDTRKPFLRTLDTLRPGMTVEQVDQLMAPYYRAPAAPGSMTTEGSVGYRHANAPWGDSDVGLVYFVDGRVIAHTFLPD
ncbi:MAG TPA: hypothetical protein VIL85_28910 [Thermomicrobiales bacterium]